MGYVFGIADAIAMCVVVRLEKNAAVLANNNFSM